MLNDRVASLTIGKGSKAVEIRDLRFSFSIEKGTGENPNRCNATIYNLAEKTRALIETVNNVLILKAGYKNDVGEVTLFTGTVTRVLTSKVGPDWITDLEMFDGLLEYRDVKTSFSYAPGVKAQAVLTGIAKTFGLAIRPLPLDIAQKSYPEGFAFVGRSREAMKKACSYLGLEWSIQNREIQILQKGKPLKKQAYLISSNTGMIGAPKAEQKTMTEEAAAKKGYTSKQKGVISTFGVNEKGETVKKLEVQGYQIKTLLQPNIEPGGYVKVESVGIKGEFFRVESVTHSGDTHGQQWESQLVLRYV